MLASCNWRHRFELSELELARSREYILRKDRLQVPPRLRILQIVPERHEPTHELGAVNHRVSILIKHPDGSLELEGLGALAVEGAEEEVHAEVRDVAVRSQE